MKKILIPFILIILSIAIVSFATAQERQIVGMKGHVEAGVGCEDCHATSNVVDSCLSCHANSDGYYRGEELDKDGNGVPKPYPEAGKTRMTAFHDMHGGPIRCTVCHTSHKPQPPLYCNNCHQFEGVVPK